MNSLILISPSLVRGFQPILSGNIVFGAQRLGGLKSALHRNYSSLSAPLRSLRFENSKTTVTDNSCKF